MATSQQTNGTNGMRTNRSREATVIVGQIITGGYYDHQDVRTREMNRMRRIIRALVEDLPFDFVENKKEQSAKAAGKYADGKLPGLVDEIRRAEKITPELAAYIKQMLELAKQARALEQRYKPGMRKFVLHEPLWSGFLFHVKGISFVLAANLVKSFGNCSKYASISALWRHCGLHVVCPECTRTVQRTFGASIRKVKMPVICNHKGFCPECGSRGISQQRTKGVALDCDLRLKNSCVENRRLPPQTEVTNLSRCLRSPQGAANGTPL